MLEGRCDAVVRLFKGADRVAEDVLDVAVGRLVHDPGQVASHDLDLAGGVFLLDRAGVDVGDVVSGCVDEPHAEHIGAQQAGVGAGTVVRSFGSKDALLDAAVADLLGPFVERARESVSDIDPGGVLRRFLADLIAFQAAHRLVGDQLRDVASPLTTRCRGDLNAVALEMIERARRDGAVRTDIDATVTLVVLSEMTHAVYRAPDYSSELAEAAVTVLMDGLRPPIL